MRRLLLTLLPILVFALLLRVGFGCLVVASHDDASFIDIHGDTTGYLQLGDRMYARKTYTAGTALHHSRGLVRPPGYPAFYTFIRALYQTVGVDLSLDLRPIVWPQIALSLGQVAVTYFIAWIAIRSVWFASLAGVFAAVSPTGIATATMAMPDSLFSVLFAAAFLGFLVSLRFKLAAAPTDAVPNHPDDATSRRRTILVHARWMSLAGLALALAAMLKPAAIYWPVFAVPVLVYVRGFRFAVFADIRQLFLPLVIVVATWTVYNGLAEDVYVYSSVSARNLRYGVVPKVELAAQLNRLPTQAEFVKYASGYTDRDNAYLKKSGSTAGKLQERITAETSAVFRAHPFWTARVFLANLRSQLVARYKMIFRQLPKSNMPMVNPIRQFIDWTDTRFALTLWYGPMLLALPLCWIFNNQVDRIALIACWLGFAYVVLPTISVADEGARLILAGEPMAITLIVASIAMLSNIRALRERFTSSPTRVDQ